MSDLTKEIPEILKTRMGELATLPPDLRDELERITEEAVLSGGDPETLESLRNQGLTLAQIRKNRAGATLVHMTLDVLGVLLRAALIVCAALVLVGCQPTLNPALVGPSIRAITDRHDAYVQADESLPPQRRKAFLDESRLLRQAVDEAASASTARQVESK